MYTIVVEEVQMSSGLRIDYVHIGVCKSRGDLLEKEKLSSTYAPGSEYFGNEDVRLAKNDPDVHATGVVYIVEVRHARC